MVTLINTIKVHVSVPVLRVFVLFLYEKKDNIAVIREANVATSLCGPHI